MYTLISGAAVKRYPYTVAQLRRDNPHTSFPASLDDALLAEWGVYRVESVARPEVDLTKTVTQGAPVLQGDKWIQTWVVSEATPEEIAERESQWRSELAQQIAGRRWQAEVAGIDIGGIRIDTGRDSQALITGATVQAMLDPSYALRWKTPDGFVDLTAEQIIGVATAARAHVQACFNREAELLEALEAWTLTPEMLEEGWPNE